MSKFAHLIDQVDLIEAFGFWLKAVMRDWSISRPAIERNFEDEEYPIFVLYENGVSTGVYKTPMEALMRIGNDQLIHDYIALVSGGATDSQSDHDPSSQP